MDKNIIDEETFLFIYKSICTFNNITYTDDDITDPDISGVNYQIIYIINKMVQKIVNLTNRSQFPEPLKYLVVDLVINDYMLITKEAEPSTNQNINSMSEAGRSVSFGATQTWQTKYNMLLEQNMQDNQSQINKFKLLYKVECPYGKN